MTEYSGLNVINRMWTKVKAFCVSVTYHQKVAYFTKKIVDMFQCLEESISPYKTNDSRIYVSGDLNARTGDRADHIENDSLHTDL